MQGSAIHQRRIARLPGLVIDKRRAWSAAGARRCLANDLRHVDITTRNAGADGVDESIPCPVLNRNGKVFPF